MSTNATKAGTIETTDVILLRLGVGKQDCRLPAGSTLGDLLRTANIDPATQDIFIDGKCITDGVVLRSGMIVSIAPPPRNGSAPGSWRNGLGMFHDDPTFREAAEAIERSREAEKDRS